MENLRNVEGWFIHTMKSELNSNSVPLLDSYGAHNESLKKLTEKNFELKKIPPRTTGQRQPADIYLFCPYKYFAKRMYDWMRIDFFEDEEQRKLSSRDNICRLQSLMYNQLSAPSFRLMLKYAWIKSSYTIADPF